MTRRDEPIRPMTLGNIRQNGVRGLFVTCLHCGHETASTWTPGLTMFRCRRSARGCGAASAATSEPMLDRTGSSGGTACPVVAPIGYCERRSRHRCTRVGTPSGPQEDASCGPFHSHQRRADAAAVSEIASGSHVSTIKAMSHLMAFSKWVSAPTSSAT